MVLQKYNKRQIGAEYERRAGAYLTECGYEILKYNFRCRIGEIDIVARDGEYLVFCEVKYRACSKKGHPLEAVNHRKQKVISKCAVYYLMAECAYDVPCRFDVVSVEGNKITLIKNAFEYVGR